MERARHCRCLLIPQYGPGPELERMLIAQLRDYGPQRLIRQESGLDRLLSLAASNYGVLLMLEGATGVRHEGLVYKEVHNGDGPDAAELRGLLAPSEWQSDVGAL